MSDYRENETRLDRPYLFEVGERPFLADAFAVVSRSRYRVDIVRREQFLGRVFYWVRRLSCDDDAELVRVRESALDPRPLAWKVTGEKTRLREMPKSNLPMWRRIVAQGRAGELPGRKPGKAAT